jgi:hypothetical protein
VRRLDAVELAAVRRQLGLLVLEPRGKVGLLGVDVGQLALL